MRTFGCLRYAHIKIGDKVGSRSRKCLFVGYPYGKKGWRLFDLEKMEFFVSHVDCLEYIFPYDADHIVPIVNVTEFDETEIHEDPPSQDRG